MNVTASRLQGFVLPTPYYERDGITIYHGDCREIAPALSDIEMVLTDPPYGMNYNTDSTRFSGGKGSHNRKRPRVHGDDEPFDPQPWIEYPKCVLWGSNHFGQMLPKGTTLVWQKKNADKFGVVLSDAEVAWEKGGHGVYLFRAVWDGCARETENGQHFHPTQKPVALMSWCIRRNAPLSVIDPFMGSGSTLLACREFSVRAIGIEIDERYCEIAANRLAQRVLF
jgi:DNA modification methylase